MKKIIPFIFLLGACASRNVPDYDTEAVGRWDQLTESEQDSICQAYNLFGIDFFEELRETTDSNDFQVDAFFKVIEEKCS